MRCDDKFAKRMLFAEAPIARFDGSIIDHQEQGIHGYFLQFTYWVVNDIVF
jgi:hypothetical protein